MKVRKVMNKKAVFVRPNSSFLEVWDLLFKKHAHAVPVVDKKGILQGIISIQDLLIKLYPSYSDTLEEFLKEANFEELEEKIDEVKSMKAAEIMSKEVHCCYPDDPILKAFSKMVIRRVRQLPVIDYDNKLLGIVSKRDIFNKLFVLRLPFKKKRK